MKDYGDIRIELNLVEDAHDFANMLYEMVINSDVKYSPYWIENLPSLIEFVNYTNTIINEHKGKQNGVVYVDH